MTHVVIILSNYMSDGTNKLTSNARRALVLAKEEAQLLRNKYCGTEHILLGLINIGDTLVSSVLENFDVDMEELRHVIYDNISQEGNDPVSIKDISLTPRVNRVIKRAESFAAKLERDKVDVEHIFLGLLYESDGVGNSVLRSFGVDFDQVKREINKELGRVDPDDDKKFIDKNDQEVLGLKNLQKYGIDLTRLAFRKKLGKFIGRETEVERVIRILCRKTKNNPVLIGEPGVGKTAIIEGLAQRIVDGNVPETIASKHVFSLDLAGMVAGTKYRGQFEERLTNVIREVKKNKNIILFIDELHLIVGAGSAEGSMDAANILKPALSRGQLRCIGATTPDEFRNSIENDGALDRRFQAVKVKEPTVGDAIKILRGIKKEFEVFHNVKYEDKVIVKAVKLSKRYITDRFLPDKAIDIIDELGAGKHTTVKKYTDLRKQKQLAEQHGQKKESLVKGQQFEEASKYRDKEREALDQIKALTSEIKDTKTKPSKITETDVEDVVTGMTGIPVRSDKDAQKKVLNLHKALSKEVIGQGDAIVSVSDSLKRSVVGINDPGRPVGSFLFLGCTGVGKTHLSKMLAENMFGNKEDIVQIDMSEMMESHSVSKLIGAPPGYVGYGKGGKLTEYIRKNPYSLVLFDEVEKAHPDVLNLLLQILEEGKITDSNGRSINFRNTVVVMTTNVGAERIQQPVPIGFSGGGTTKDRHKYVEERALDEVKKHFKPEFLNRIDDLIVFNNLGKEQLEQIVQLNFKDYTKRAQSQHKVSLKLNKSAIDLILEKGYDEKFGAREINRTIKKLFETRYATELLSGKIPEGSIVSIGARAKKLTLTVTKD